MALERVLELVLVPELVMELVLVVPVVLALTLISVSEVLVD